VQEQFQEKMDFIKIFKYCKYGAKCYGLWSRNIGYWEEKEELEKIMMDYIRWMFNLDFCTRYLIMKELLMDKLRVGIRAKRFERKIKSGRVGNLTNASWQEKKNDWGDGQERRIML